MSEMMQFFDGNTQTLINETPLDQVPEAARWAVDDDGTRVEIVRVVRFSFDERGELAPPERAYNGFLKFFDREGRQVKESFLTYKPGAKLFASNLPGLTEDAGA